MVDRSLDDVHRDYWDVFFNYDESPGPRIVPFFRTKYNKTMQVATGLVRGAAVIEIWEGIQPYDDGLPPIKGHAIIYPRAGLPYYVPISFWEARCVGRPPPPSP